MKTRILALMLSMSICKLYSQSFSKVVVLDNCYGQNAEWGDFDRDGDLDILVFYKDVRYGNKKCTRILENELDSFKVLDVGLPNIDKVGYKGLANWIDYNDDGFLDVFLTINGEGTYDTTKIKLFKNNGNKTFTDIKIDSLLPNYWNVYDPVLVDFDNDGDYDFIYTKEITNIYNSLYNYNLRIMENIGDSSYVDIGNDSIYGIMKSRKPWADFNNDGYLDLLTSEPKSASAYNIAIYKNNGNKTFTKIIYKNLIGLDIDIKNQSGEMKWLDYNNDGYIDIIITGTFENNTGTGISKIYKNNGDETFSESGITIPRLYQDVSIDVGDINNDGDIDMLFNGECNYGSYLCDTVTVLYNNNNSFIINRPYNFIHSHQDGLSVLGDYNNDGNMDILSLGDSSFGFYPKIVLYKNLNNYKNTKPEAPKNLHVEISSSEITLEWDNGSDIETPSSALSYNIYLIKDNDTIISSYALSDGKRIIVGNGNAQHNNFFKLRKFDPGIYKWSVQSIDNSFEGSSFAAEETFECTLFSTKNDEIKHNEIQIGVYPNPIKDIFIIDCNKSIDYRFNLVLSDAVGRQLIYMNNLNLPYSFHSSDLESGIYFLTIVRGEYKYTQKLIKK